MKLRSGDVLRAFMKQHGLSMQALANYAGCSKAFVGHLTSGTKQSCTPELATRIAEVLGVPVDVLFAARPSTNSGHSGHKGAA